MQIIIVNNTKNKSSRWRLFYLKISKIWIIRISIHLYQILTMKISVVCGSRARDLTLLLKFLKMLDLQTFKDFDVNIVCDRNFTGKEELDFFSFFEKQNLEIIKHTSFFTNNNSEFNPNHRWWASYVRNFGIKKAKGEFIQLFDDDNEVDSKFLENCLKKREELTEKTKSECVILPSLYYRDTGQIQNQWFSYFNYRQSRPVLHLLNWKRKAQIQMFSWNWIFSKFSTIGQAKYDEKIARISEDLDYTLSLHEQWIQLRVFSDLKVNHHERDKTRLEQARIWSYSQAKQKSRNRFLFTKKHWNKKQLFQFYICWLPGCILRLSTKAILFWGKDRFKIIKWLLAGVKEWYKLIHKK